MVDGKEDGLYNVPVDRGFAWVVCLACSLNFFVTLGVAKSLGVMLLEFQSHFQSPPEQTSLTVALVAAGFFLFVFVSNTIGMIIGNRNIAIAGAILAFISMLTTSFAPNIIFVVIFLGLLSGLAYSATYGPPLVILSAYFLKRRALATGLALAGGSIGQLVLPILFSFIISEYGFQGGMLIFSAVVMHAIPAAMLMRPPAFWDRRPKSEMHDLNNENATPEKEKGGCKMFIDVLKVMVDKELLRSGLFQMLVASVSVSHLGYFGCLIFLPSCAESFFNNRQLSVTLISVMGVCDLFGRLLGGLVVDLRKIPINDVMGICLVLPGVVTLFGGLFPSVWLLFVATCIMGVFAGAYDAMLAPVIVEYFGLSKVSSGFGLMTFLMGLLIIPWPTVLAILYTATGTYKSVLAIGGLMQAIGGTMFFLLRFMVKKELRMRKAQEAARDAIGASAEDPDIIMKVHPDAEDNVSLTSSEADNKLDLNNDKA